MTVELYRGLESLVAHARMGVILVKACGSIVYVNSFTERMFGYEAGEMIGLTVESLVPDSRRHEHQNSRQMYTAHPVPRQMGGGLDLQAKRKDGSLFPVEISLTHYEHDGQSGTVAFVNDISYRKQVEDMERRHAAELEREVASRTAELSASLDKLMQLSEAKSRFVSLASHEFRSPLSTILTSISLIDRYADPENLEKRNKHINRIKSSVRMMTHILEDFLSLDKLEQGKIATEPVLFPIENLFREVQGDLENNTKQDQRIEAEVTGGNIVCMDKRIVKNILVNLTSNAIKYSDAGSQIQLRCEVMNRKVEIRVIDEGIGIPRRDQAQLFGLFHRGSNVGSIRGTGLGLNIVKKYVDLLGGEISFTSREGEGTTFVIVLPQNTPHI